MKELTACHNGGTTLRVVPPLPLGADLRDPPLRPDVHVDQAGPVSVAVDPLEVVLRAPVEVAVHRHALRRRAAVLGDEDGLRGCPAAREARCSSVYRPSSMTVMRSAFRSRVARSSASTCSGASTIGTATWLRLPVPPVPARRLRAWCSQRAPGFLCMSWTSCGVRLSLVRPIIVRPPRLADRRGGEERALLAAIGHRGPAAVRSAPSRFLWIFPSFMMTTKFFAGSAISLMSSSGLPSTSSRSASAPSSTTPSFPG